MKTKLLNFNWIWKVFHILCFIIVSFVFIYKCFALPHPIDIHVETPEVKEYLDDLENIPITHFTADDKEDDEEKEE